MKKLVFIASLILSVGFLSCEEQLVEDPKALLSPSTFWETEEDAIAGVNAIFSPLANGSSSTSNPSANGVYQYSFHFLADLSTDDIYTDPRKAAAARAFSTLSLTAEDELVSAVWQRTYQSINRANDAIKNIPGIDMDDDNKSMLIGEAKFLRALNYFNLVRFFGEVPLRLEATSDIQSANLLKTSELDVYEAIVADLTSNEVDALPENASKSILGDGAVCKAAAHTLLAKVYMTMAGEPLLMTDYKGNNLWQLANNEIGKVTGFSLYDNYADVFKIDNENEYRENIFEIQFKSGYGDLGAGFGNVMGQQSTPHKTPQTNSNKLFNMLGKFLPTPMLSASFEDGDNRKNMIRYDYTSYLDGSKYTFPEPGFMWKYVDEGAMKIHMVAEGKSFRDDDMNYRVFRYADVLLMKAEVENEINNGPSQEAYDAIKEVRNRAGLSELSGLDYNSFKSAVIQERRVELWFEGHRWFDLKRWGKLQETMEGLTFVELGKNSEVVVNYEHPKHLYFPIPVDEINANEGISLEQQNTGW
ncbi:RagB/SusD family nutrient uptake outer membrane protein [Puteibacter caeruleilacunae]|nr:RagB/SusD family nutrient uptake outer membrane protein [Puteibacter caeruleilacunae]